jgi:hypothetical protein
MGRWSKYDQGDGSRDLRRQDDLSIFRDRSGKIIPLSTVKAEVDRGWRAHLQKQERREQARMTTRTDAPTSATHRQSADPAKSAHK